MQQGVCTTNRGWSSICTWYASCNVYVRNNKTSEDGCTQSSVSVRHYITAKYWHNVKKDGIHFTVSDTGWGKALWGKLYGQWLSETCIFVYDFDVFSADNILKLIEQYQITTFCAPPTLYRILVKMDLSKYDLSSLTYCTTAGEALNPEVFYKFKEMTGFTIFEGFGQTETTLAIGNLKIQHQDRVPWEKQVRCMMFKLCGRMERLQKWVKQAKLS